MKPYYVLRGIGSAQETLTHHIRDCHLNIPSQVSQALQAVIIIT